VRQIRAISEFDKAMTVAKLRGARERRRREVGKCEGRKSHAERNPELVFWRSGYTGASPKAGACRCGRSRLSQSTVGLCNEPCRWSVSLTNKDNAR
jgi:hypothetical protein